MLKPTSFPEQERAFQKLLQEIKEKRNIGVIIVDGATMLYRLELAEAVKGKDDAKIREINSKLAEQLRILTEISRKRNIPVIVTNQVYSEFLSKQEYEAGKEKQVHMVGGDILSYWSKCIIELQNLQGKKKAILRKHRALPEKEMQYVITAAGIERSRRFW